MIRQFLIAVTSLTNIPSLLSLCLTPLARPRVLLLLLLLLHPPTLQLSPPAYPTAVTALLPRGELWHELAAAARQIVFLMCVTLCLKDPILPQQTLGVVG